jgi:DNA polymerase-3 subunit alpha
MEKQRLEFEKEAIGFYLTGHPLWRFQSDVTRLGATALSALGDKGNMADVGVVGVVAALRERPMKDGSGRWAIVTLEDLSGQSEVLVFSKVFQNTEVLLKKDEPLYIKGRVLVDDATEEGADPVVKLRAEDVKLLSDIRAAQARRLVVQMNADAAEKHLGRVFDLARESNGSCFLRFEIVIPEESCVAILDSPETVKVSPTDDFVQRIEQVLGRGSVVVL